MKYLRLSMAIAALSAINALAADTPVPIAGKFRLIDGDVIACPENLIIIAKGTGYPGFTIELIIDRRSCDVDGNCSSFRKVTIFPFTSLGVRRDDSVWNQRVASQADGCFVMRDTIFAHDPSDSGLSEVHRFCFDRDNNQLLLALPYTDRDGEYLKCRFAQD